MQLTQNTCIETGDSSIKYGASVDILAETADLEERYRVHNTENSVDTAGDQDGLDWSGV